MNDALEDLVKSWITTNLPDVLNKPTNMIEHIDYILEDWLPPSEWIPVSKKMFLILLNHLKPHHMPVKPILTLTLNYLGNQVSFSVPNSLAAVEKQLYIEPPSIGMINWQLSAYLRVLEEYKIPLRFDFLDTQEEGLYVYYHEYRFVQDINNDWDFHRRITVEYYPEKYRLPEKHRLQVK